MKIRNACSDMISGQNSYGTVCIQNVYIQSESACELSSWICQQMFCHSEHIHRVFLQYVISYDPVEAMV